MKNDLRQHIAEIYDGGTWESITGRLYKNDSPFELWKFERDVEFEGTIWRCIIIQKVVFDLDDPEAVDYAEDVFSDAWAL